MIYQKFQLISLKDQYQFLQIETQSSKRKRVRSQKSQTFSENSMAQFFTHPWITICILRKKFTIESLCFSAMRNCASGLQLDIEPYEFFFFCKCQLTCDVCVNRIHSGTRLQESYVDYALFYTCCLFFGIRGSVTLFMCCYFISYYRINDMFSIEKYPCMHWDGLTNIASLFTLCTVNSQHHVETEKAVRVSWSVTVGCACRPADCVGRDRACWQEGRAGSEAATSGERTRLSPHWSVPPSTSVKSCRC